MNLDFIKDIQDVYKHGADDVDIPMIITRMAALNEQDPNFVAVSKTGFDASTSTVQNALYLLFLIQLQKRDPDALECLKIEEEGRPFPDTTFSVTATMGRRLYAVRKEISKKSLVPRMLFLEMYLRDAMPEFTVFVKEGVERTYTLVQFAMFTRSHYYSVLLQEPGLKPRSRFSNVIVVDSVGTAKRVDKEFVVERVYADEKAAAGTQHVGPVPCLYVDKSLFIKPVGRDSWPTNPVYDGAKYYADAIRSVWFGAPRTQGFFYYCRKNNPKGVNPYSHLALRFMLARVPQRHQRSVQRLVLRHESDVERPEDWLYKHREAEVPHVVALRVELFAKTLASSQLNFVYPKYESIGHELDLLGWMIPPDSHPFIDREPFLRFEDWKISLLRMVLFAPHMIHILTPATPTPGWRPLFSLLRRLWNKGTVITTQDLDSVKAMLPAPRLASLNRFLTACTADKSHLVNLIHTIDFTNEVNIQSVFINEHLNTSDGSYNGGIISSNLFICRYPPTFGFERTLLCWLGNQGFQQLSGSKGPDTGDLCLFLRNRALD